MIKKTCHIVATLVFLVCMQTSDLVCMIPPNRELLNSGSGRLSPEEIATIATMAATVSGVTDASLLINFREMQFKLIIIYQKFYQDPSNPTDLIPLGELSDIDVQHRNTIDILFTRGSR